MYVLDEHLPVVHRIYNRRFHPGAYQTTTRGPSALSGQGGQANSHSKLHELFLMIT